MLIGGVFAVAAVGIGLYLILKKRGKKDFFSVLECKEVDTLAMSDVIKFFKQPDILAKLKENKDFIAVAMKQNETDGSIKVVCTVFDKASDIADIQTACCYHAKKLDADLQDAFGDKPMLVLQ